MSQAWELSTHGAEVGVLSILGQLGLNSETVSKTKGWGCSSVVECLPGMTKAMGLICDTAIKNYYRYLGDFYEGLGIRW
jgi:hypothetical protein